MQIKCADFARWSRTTSIRIPHPGGAPVEVERQCQQGDDEYSDRDARPATGDRDGFSFRHVMSPVLEMFRRDKGKIFAIRRYDFLNACQLAKLLS